MVYIKIQPYICVNLSPNKYHLSGGWGVDVAYIFFIILFYIQVPVYSGFEIDTLEIEIKEVFESTHLDWLDRSNTPYI